MDCAWGSQARVFAGLLRLLCVAPVLCTRPHVSIHASSFNGTVCCMCPHGEYVASTQHSSTGLPPPRALHPSHHAGMPTPSTPGGFERLHYLLESFFDTDGDMSPFFARTFEGWMPWDTNPLYVLLHEAIYCQGVASNWAAHRVREAEFALEFDAAGLTAKGERSWGHGPAKLAWKEGLLEPAIACDGELVLVWSRERVFVSASLSAVHRLGLLPKRQQLPGCACSE